MPLKLHRAKEMLTGVEVEIGSSFQTDSSSWDDLEQMMTSLNDIYQKALSSFENIDNNTFIMVFPCIMNNMFSNDVIDQNRTY